MVIRQFDHERLDERLDAPIDRIRNHVFHLVLQPRAGSSNRLGNLARVPRLAMHQTADHVLQRLITFGMRFADQDRCFLRQLRAAVDGCTEGTRDIIDMHERLAVRRIAGKYAAQHLPLIDALDLVRQRRYLAIVGVHAGDAKDQCRNIAAFLMNDSLRINLRLRIGPGRLQWRVLIDYLPRRRWRMDQHRARINELLDLERTQRTQQTARALDIHAVIQRIGFTRKIVERSKMDHCGKTIAMARMQHGACFCQCLVGSDISFDAIGFPALSFEADNRIGAGQCGRNRAAESPTGSSNQHHWLLQRHAFLLQIDWSTQA